MELQIRSAVEADVEHIYATLRANADDASLFQQSSQRIRKDLADFLVATLSDRIVGCAALHHHSTDCVEILAVAVEPSLQGHGVGGALMRACLDRAANAEVVWLATAKPEYFAHYGFKPFSRWGLSMRTLLRKLGLIFEQPVGRWVPALFGRHTFMRR
jgi:amino-acid N-acetyltransferase